MKYCKECGKKIDDKYKYCWNCNEKIKRESQSHLKQFTCANCHQTMYSMLWPGNLCCNCYAKRSSLKQNECVQEKDLNSLPLKTLEDDIHET